MKGVGVLLNELFTDYEREAKVALDEAIGQEIVHVTAKDDVLRFVLANGKTLSVEDDGQSCCENRYMTCDDDLDYFDGAILRQIEVRDMDGGEDDRGECHEQQALVVTTSKGSFTVVTHNEHNGYYGGFSLNARLS